MYILGGLTDEDAQGSKAIFGRTNKGDKSLPLIPFNSHSLVGVEWTLERKLPKPVSFPACTTVLGSDGNTKVILFGYTKCKLLINA